MGTGYHSVSPFVFTRQTHLAHAFNTLGDAGNSQGLIQIRILNPKSITILIVDYLFGPQKWTHKALGDGIGKERWCLSRRNEQVAAVSRHISKQHLW